MNTWKKIYSYYLFYKKKKKIVVEINVLLGLEIFEKFIAGVQKMVWDGNRRHFDKNKWKKKREKNQKIHGEQRNTKMECTMQKKYIKMQNNDKGNETKRNFENPVQIFLGFKISLFYFFFQHLQEFFDLQDDLPLVPIRLHLSFLFNKFFGVC